MATYSQQCSQVGSFSYASNFYLYVVLTDRDGNPSTNKSIVDYNVYCQSNGSGSLSANHQLYFELNGQVIRNENVYVNVKSPNAYIGIASGSMEVAHNSDGTKSISFSASIGATGGYGVSASKADTFTLNTIPRHANLTSLKLISTSLNSATFSFTADKSCKIYLNLNNGQNWLNNGQPFVQNVTSGTITLKYKDRASTQRLDYNTSYRMTVLCRSVESGLDTSQDLNFTTKDKARITKVSNIEHGDSLNVEYSNPSGSSIEIGIWKTDGTTQLTGGYRSCSGSSYVFNFTDEELDNIYKLYGNDNQITLRVYIRTAGSSNYINYKDFIVTLTGNQKTIKVKDGNEYKRGKIWVKINDTWKRGIIWAKQTEWKRGI